MLCGGELGNTGRSKTTIWAPLPVPPGEPCCEFPNFRLGAFPNLSSELLSLSLSKIPLEKKSPGPQGEPREKPWTEVPRDSRWHTPQALGTRVQQESWVYGSLAQKRRAKDDSGGRLHPAWGHPGPTPCPQSPVAETRAKSSQLWHTWWCGLFLPTVPSACQVCQPLNPRPREGPCLACPFGLPNCSPCTHSSFMQIKKRAPLPCGTV